jgi:molybdate transport system permease protein
MSTHRPPHFGRHTSLAFGLPMLALLATPILGLVLGTSASDVAAGFRHPLFADALALSAQTTVGSLLIIVVLGTPLAWWIAVGPNRQTRWVELIVDVPIVVPPAVIGIGLLQTFGRSGVVGSWLSHWDLQIPFSTSAVVLAQVVVAAPFFIQSAAAAFRRVDPEMVIVARTLGHTGTSAFLCVTLPVALPGLLGGAALSWARALGEFGATLLFAGNFPGTTQTMPLAIYRALEADIRTAVALSLVLAITGVVLLFLLRWLPALWLDKPQEVQSSRKAFNPEVRP